MKFKEYLKTKTIGLIEPIVIFLADGEKVGETTAKIDTGNDGVNVIDGQNIQMLDGYVKFTFGGKELNLKVYETIDVHIGDSKIDRRPVVALTIDFNNKRYKNVLFSVANREMNEQKVLISKLFISKMGVLVDVNK